MQNTLFWIFSFGIFFFALLVIASRNPVNSAMFLILMLFCISGLFVLLQAYFLAAVQILVYAGAVMVLFLFVIMLLNLPEENKHKLHWFGMVGGFIVGGTLIFEFVYIINRSRSLSIPASPDLIGSTENVGKLLFTKYLLPFEVASLILLIAMIGVIILSKKEPKT